MCVCSAPLASLTESHCLLRLLNRFGHFAGAAEQLRPAAHRLVSVLVEWAFAAVCHTATVTHAGFERNSSLKSLSISQWALASTDLEASMLSGVT